MPADARREAVRRLLQSAALEKATRLKELLAFLAERSIEDRSEPITEQEIAVSFFGRPDYAANHDNIVRVQVTQLRKKLQQYFAAEGAGDSVIIEIPRGNYSLRFRHSDSVSTTAKPGASRRRLVLLAVLTAAGVFATGWVARGLLSGDPAPQPAVRRLWAQFFGNGRQVHIVLADANLQMFQDFVLETIGVRRYGRTNFMEKLVQERFQDPEVRRVVMRTAGKYFVTLQDAVAARKIEAFGLPANIAVRFGFARSFQIEPLMADNAILLGNRRANPWAELFENQLRFRFNFDEKQVAAWFEDTQAKAGETQRYATNWDRASHCRIAMLPNLRQKGSVLTIAGGDQSAVEAGSEFLTSERWVFELGRRLGVGPDGRFPHFEVFLKTETVSDAAPSFTLLFCRKVE